MIEFVDRMVLALQTGNILWLAVIGVIAFSTKAHKLLEFLEGRKKAQINKLLEASKCEFLDQNFKNFISQEIQREYFIYITNIPAEKQYRDKLFEVHKNTNGNIPFYHFKRAKSYLKFEDEILSVNINWYNKIDSFINLCGAILLGSISFFMFIIPIFMVPISVIQALTYYGIGIFFAITAFLFSIQTFPLYSAKLIQREINNKIE